MWSHIPRLTDSKSNTVLHPLTYHGKTYNTPAEISNVLAATYSEISSNSNYEPSFLHHKNEEEKTHSDISANYRSLPYNQPISGNEVRTAIQQCSQKAAPGIDLIMSVMFNHLHTNAL